MLKQRILTAIVLLATLLIVLASSSPWPLVLLTIVVAGSVCWEWLRLSLSPRFNRLALPIALMTAAATLLMAVGLLATPAGALSLALSYWLEHSLIPLVIVAWLIGAPLAIVRAHTASRRHPFVLSVFGVAATLALWLSLVRLYLDYGAWFLVSLLALIWFADSVAYFVGKIWGKRRLAPAVSPGKTWEGAAGGVLGALKWMLLSSLWANSFAGVLVQRWGWGAMILSSVFLVGLSIVGDLFESLLKRRAHVKDSSGLLPGHGGVFDRIDALFPVAPMAFLMAVLL